MMKKPEKDWKKKLNPKEYHILREKGTEIPFTGKMLYNKEKGEYLCAACGNKIFSSDTKYDSHCGWHIFLLSGFRRIILLQYMRN